jgi:hypothetical protein
VSSVAADPAFDFARIRAELERHLGPTAAEDPRLERWYGWARLAASEWLCNTWTDADGAELSKSNLVIDGIKLALFEGARAQHRQATKMPGLTAVSTGGTSETYGAASGGGAIAMTAMATLLYPFRLSIELL